MSKIVTSCEDKALEINLEPRFYGTFAEIGAGQEVARHLFRVGGAAGTIAKSISAYDMKFSDAIYGPSDRYVSRARAQTMLDFEFSLLQERLSEERRENTCFFTFADTVAARSYSRKRDGNGWLGLKFQHEPSASPSQVLIHSLLLDKESVLQQEALGILGLNLLYGTLFFHQDPHRAVAILRDQLAEDRVDVNHIEYTGPAFTDVNNRLLNLELIHQRLTHAVFFDADGVSVEPGEVLYKKPILVQRGTFRPITHVHEHMLASARRQFADRTKLDDDDIVSLMEITTANLRETAGFDSADFLSRLDTLEVLRKPVLISNFSEFHRLESYLHRYSDRDIVFAIGVHVLVELFSEKYYQDLDGGSLEGLGRLFKRKVKLYVYPSRDPEPGRTLTARDIHLPDAQQRLLEYLLESELVVPIEEFRDDLFHIISQSVLSGIRTGDTQWETQVPPAVVNLIKERGLFHYPSSL